MSCFSFHIYLGETLLSASLKKTFTAADVAGIAKYLTDDLANVDSLVLFIYNVPINYLSYHFIYVYLE